MNKTASLTPFVKSIVCDKHTEMPNYRFQDDLVKPGTYLCRNCGLALFRASHEFNSGCGWPAFDQEIDPNIKKVLDNDGIRTEILCNRCNAHIGHVFYGEGFTSTNTRHCANLASLDYVSNLDILDTEEAIIAGGCFWGVEYYMQKLSGVLKTEVGYCGGHKENPNYQEVCNHNTGHLEAMRIIYDPQKITYEQILKYFFEIHDFTQTNGQGPDIGEQYLSAIFYYNEKQLETIQNLIDILKNKGYKAATRTYPVTTFWPAEQYHQNYYKNNQKEPYCQHWKNLS